MSSPDDGRSVPSLTAVAKPLTTHSQSKILLRKAARFLGLATLGNRKTPKLRRSCSSIPLERIPPQQPSPIQVLRKARSALLQDEDELSVDHPLRRRVDKNDDILEPILPPRAPRSEHVLPLKPPKPCLRGLTRAMQRDRVGVRNRMVVTSEAQDQLRKKQILKVELKRWKDEEPRFLAGLGTIFMGPSADASAETVLRWVRAKAELKQHLSFDEMDLEFFEKQKLILVNPETGLPLDWVLRISKWGLPWFLNIKTEEKRWNAPKGTDLFKFHDFFEEVLKRT